MGSFWDEGWVSGQGSNSTSWVEKRLLHIHPVLLLHSTAHDAQRLVRGLHLFVLVRRRLGTQGKDPGHLEVTISLQLAGQ